MTKKSFFQHLQIAISLSLSIMSPLRNSIELAAQDRAGIFKRFKFEGVSNLEIEKGVDEYLGGTTIAGIRVRR
ncbi:hypothetical protein QWZ16_17480 [Vibrio ostreicida]|uniref:Uncharacterized protein n=1 Tax=Vibrio ostreicida TaxID=526588 RepID=A0ABT8BW42_9VIBR|nr:hypothetical protein [Vibrio ostreicida]MDN3611396.1 hypothetical protein [Vibrio ostreicida]